jgi:5-methylthioadenosine/S-adenosylhomocysteine deaminase
VVVDLGGPHAYGFGEKRPEDVFTRLVYNARAADVRTVLVGGRIVVRHGRLLTLDVGAVLEEAREQRERLLRRAAL